jgi:hypothetical protein
MSGGGSGCVCSPKRRSDARRLEDQTRLPRRPLDRRDRCPDADLGVWTPGAVHADSYPLHGQRKRRTPACVVATGTRGGVATSMSIQTLLVDRRLGAPDARYPDAVCVNDFPRGRGRRITERTATSYERFLMTWANDRIVPWRDSKGAG